jgi:cytochrome oxidase Cu insertion factor (SCO1/SenC/PrrC family)
MKKVVVLLAVVLILCVGMAFAEYQPGDHVNDFTLSDSSGNMVSLYDYSDEIVVLFFWEDG